MEGKRGLGSDSDFGLVGHYGVEGSGLGFRVYGFGLRVFMVLFGVQSHLSYQQLPSESLRGHMTPKNGIRKGWDFKSTLLGGFGFWVQGRLGLGLRLELQSR